MKTAVEKIIAEIDNEVDFLKMTHGGTEIRGRMIGLAFAKRVALEAKEMETEQKAYSKEDVLKAGEMGEINHLDTKHIVSYLDEAKQYNETFKQQEQ